MRCKLKDFCTVINGRAYSQKELLDKGKYRVLRVGNFFSSDRWYFSDLELSAEKYCNKGDLLFAWACSFGPRIWDGEDRTIFHYHIWKLDIDSAVVDKKYLYYLLKISVDSMTAGTHGSVMMHITKSDMENFEFDIPTLEVQKKIAAILSALDEKIATNRAINDNLLEQASSIYQAWFEDFILSDGSCPPSWKQGILAGIADITSGKRPPVKSAEKTDNAIIPIVGAASVMGYTTEANHTDKILVTGRVGTHGVVQRFNSPCWASDNTLVITSAFYEYTFQILQRIDYRAMNRGSTQPLITQGDMNKVPILIPDNETLLKFETLVGQLMKQYQVNLLENDKLAELRDALLPRLMSGELDVSDLDI